MTSDSVGKLQFVEDDEVIGEGDTELVQNILPSELAETAFEKLSQEVQWQAMRHRGGEVPRLVAQEGEIAPDGSFPIYRHPSDKSPPLLPFSPTVALIREHVQKALNHPVNHVLIQHYRSGADFISEHSDKTIDVVPGSRIVNVSLGARRHMTLRSKDAQGGNGRRIQRVKLPHNSMFVLGLETNAKWQHSVKHDNRPEALKDEDERYNNGERISLTFRHIGTFISQDERLIWGQGAKGKTKEEAQPVVNGGPDAEKLLIAFGTENHTSNFDWNAHYGEGFNVFHLTPDIQPDSNE
ncbi:hypothetical protein BDY19DRAFT_962707 [Irpex rosettiformis]|uniref:Uncharacterized protein n=1 Tax=Irpex rosettiformis TaxID=378272 RepID=A0ACB8TVM9_9APHY|nr:hypothetical protein BDY19DRAFT_962707 [Irpex rosettiformis]